MDYLLTKLGSSWPWYTTRASGFVAVLLLALLIISGVGLLTGLTYKVLEPLAAWRAHRALGLSFGISVILHIFSLLFDKFVGFDLADLLVPFHSAYQPVTIAGRHVGSLYLAMGIIAWYMLAAIIISSLLWINKKPRPWHLIHYLSYVVLALVFVHGLFMGTDLKHGVLRWIWLGVSAVIALVLIQRLWRSHTIDEGSNGA